MVTDDLPDRLVMEFREELEEFRVAICELDMPTIDYDAMMEMITEAVQDFSDDDHQLKITAFYMSEGEGLFENHEMDNAQEERVHRAVLKLGKQIKNKLFHLNAYREDQFPYILGRMLNANDAIFNKHVT